MTQFPGTGQPYDAAARPGERPPGSQGYGQYVPGHATASQYGPGQSGPGQFPPGAGNPAPYGGQPSSMPGYPPGGAVPWSQAPVQPGRLPAAAQQQPAPPIPAEQPRRRSVMSGADSNRWADVFAIACLAVLAVLVLVTIVALVVT